MLLWDCLLIFAFSASKVQSYAIPCHKITLSSQLSIHTAFNPKQVYPSLGTGTKTAYNSQSESSPKLNKSQQSFLLKVNPFEINIAFSFPATYYSWLFLLYLMQQQFSALWPIFCPFNSRPPHHSTNSYLIQQPLICSHLSSAPSSTIR